MDDLTARERRLEQAVQFLESPRPAESDPASLARWYERNASACTVLRGEAERDQDPELIAELDADRDRYLSEARRLRRGGH